MQELAPAPDLREFVQSYHYSEADTGNTPVLRALTARPESMLQFSFEDPFTVIERSRGAATVAPAVVAVVRQTRRRIHIVARGHMKTLTVHFEPGGFFRLFGIPASELTDLTPDAVDVLGPDVRVLHERLHQASSPESMVLELEDFLHRQAQDCKPFHPVQTAASKLLADRGMSDLSRLVRSSDLSLRQFERAFQLQVGVAPKLFSRIVRFSNALETKYAAPERTWADVAATAGYYDQAHFVRDCRMLGSDTPSALIRTWLPCNLRRD